MKTLRNLNLSQMKNFARSQARKFDGKDAVIGLVGPLGSGKTAFTKAFAAYYGIKKIKSPTFIVGSVYKLPAQHLYHYDFYRLENKKQLSHLGVDEILQSRNRIVLIEWVDKFPAVMKKCDEVLTFKVTGKNLRHVTIR